MEDSLDELVEKTETGYNLVVTQENKQIWTELIKEATAAARKGIRSYTPEHLWIPLWRHRFG